MKATTLRILVGVAVPLILTGSVEAGFTGITTTSKPNPFGLLVVNVYAVFDRPGEDHMIAVAGTPQNPLTIQVNGGTFYQHGFGTDQASIETLHIVFPSLAFDSFVTIGVKFVGTLLGGQPVDELVLTTAWPGFGPSVLAMTDAAWAITPDNAQGNPFDAVNSFPGNGQILIGQFSTANGTSFQGTMLLQYISNGVSETSVVSFFHVPGPGALWLLGAMGLLGSRRRP